MTSAPATPTVTDFLRDVARSRVLSDVDVSRLFEATPPERKWEAKSLADHWVEIGKLTRYQADKILRGQFAGLALGPYRLLAPLGRGSMGIVYLTSKVDAPDQLLALKLLPPKRAAEEPRTLARFLREMQFGQALPNHPCLTRTLEAGEVAGVHYLALEYVAGKTARQQILETGPLSVSQAARIFADVALGLQAAHSLGFIHRDIKPSNVMVLPSGRGKVLDFGFALKQGESTPADPAIIGGGGYTVGTMDYLAPEQADNAATVGPSADLYSLGCSLYFAVTGSPPFPNGTVFDKIRWHRTAEPAPVESLSPKVTPEFAAVIQRLMSKLPEQRPATAEVAAQMLAPFAEPIRVEPVVIASPAEIVRQLDQETVVFEKTDEMVMLTDDDQVPEHESKSTDRTWISARSAYMSIFFLILALFTAGFIGWCVGRLMEK